MRRIAIALFLVLLLAGCGSKAVKDAQAFVDVKEYGRAKELLELELKANPKNEEAYLLLGTTNLLAEEEDAARKAFDTALLLDKDNKERISAAYARAGQSLYEGIPGGEEVQTERVRKAVAYLATAITYHSDAKQRIEQWALRVANDQATASRTTHPLNLLGNLIRIDPAFRTDAARLAMKTANAYSERLFTEEAAIYARSAGSWDPSHLKPAARLLREAGIASNDADYLRLAIKWDAALDDEAVAWAFTKANAIPVMEYLRRYPTGAHANEARALVPPPVAEPAPLPTAATASLTVSADSEETTTDQRPVRDQLSLTSTNISYARFEELLREAPHRIINTSDLDPLQRLELTILRNSIYARHGRPFKSSLLRTYFISEPWYRENPAYHDGLLTTIDRANITTISAAERRAR